MQFPFLKNKIITSSIRCRKNFCLRLYWLTYTWQIYRMILIKTHKACYTNCRWYYIIEIQCNIILRGGNTKAYKQLNINRLKRKHLKKQIE